MRLRGVNLLKKCLRIMTAPLRSQVAILMYHRVCEVPSDPWELCVTPTHFAEQLDYLRQHYRILPLRALVRFLQNGQVPKRAVVVTFDDGYADNLWNAKPLLERYSAPATVFVTTGYLGRDREFWWDDLERLILLTPKLPDRLNVTLKDSVYEWKLEESSKSLILERELHLQSRTSLDDTATSRDRAYSELHELLRPLGHEEREAAVELLRAQIDTNGNGRPDYRALRTDEVLRLAEGGLVEIGSHSVTHPTLSVQPADVQRQEMAESKRHLEMLLGQAVTTFSYPYGDTCETTTQLAQEVGFDAACIANGKTVRRGMHPFQLPRHYVGDWNGDEIGRRLRKIFSG